MTMPDGIPGEGTQAQILLKLGEISTQVAVITEKLAALPDHENRIRKLEAARWPLPTVAAVSAAIAAIAAVAAYVHH